MSELFEKVREKMVKNDPSESRRFLLRIGRTNFELQDQEESKTTTLDQAGCIKESTIDIIFLPPLKTEASAISSPESDLDLGEHSTLYVEYENNLLQLEVCLSQDTVSVLFRKVFERLQYSPSPSIIFFPSIACCVAGLEDGPSVARWHTQELLFPSRSHLCALLQA